MKKFAIVGSGIKTISHLTTEAKAYITEACKVLYLVNEPVMQEWLKENSKTSECLDAIYFDYDKRLDAYHAIASKVIDEIKQHEFVCLVLYGHPTIFAAIGLDALALAKEEQLEIDHVTIPGISAMDCLFADLGVDPGDSGCFSIDVNDLLLFNKTIEPHSHLILWQIGMIGNCGKPSYEVSREKLIYLKEYLGKYYPSSQPITLYEASLYPAIPAKIETSTLEQLETLDYTPISSLYISPKEQPELNEEAAKRLGLTRALLQRSH
jgi:precorrin-3B methylase